MFSLKIHQKVDQMLLVTSFGVTQVKENLTELKKEQGEILIQKFLVSTWLCELAIS